MYKSTPRNATNQPGKPTNGFRKEGVPLSEDAVFDLLQNENRRIVLEEIRDREGKSSVRELSEAVASRESGTSVSQLPSERIQQVRIALAHQHLPKLDEAGIVNYDRDRDVVEGRRLAHQLDAYLGDTGGGTESSDREPTDEVGTADEGLGAWTRYYMYAVALGAALVAGHDVGVLGLSALSGTRVALLVVVAFSVVTMFKIVDDTRTRSG